MKSVIKRRIENTVMSILHLKNIVQNQNGIEFIFNAECYLKMDNPKDHT